MSGGGVMDVDHPVPLVGDTLFGGESTSPPPLPPPRLEGESSVQVDNISFKLIPSAPSANPHPLGFSCPAA